VVTPLVIEVQAFLAHLPENLQRLEALAQPGRRVEGAVDPGARRRERPGRPGF